MSVANALLKLLNSGEQPLKLRRFEPRHLGQELTCQDEIKLRLLPAYSFGRGGGGVHRRNRRRDRTVAVARSGSANRDQRVRGM